MTTKTLDDGLLLSFAIAGVLAGWTASRGHRELTGAGAGIGRSRVYEAWRIAGVLLDDGLEFDRDPKAWDRVARHRARRAVPRVA